MLLEPLWPSDYSWRNWLRVLLLLVLLGGVAQKAEAAAERAGTPRGERVIDVQDFERIHLRGAAQLIVEQGVLQSVRVQADEGILEKLVIESSDGVLYIDTDDGHDAQALVIRMTVADLREIVTVGAGVVHANGLRIAELALEGRGASRFELSGVEVNDLYVNGTGAARFEVSGHAKRQVIVLAGLGTYRGDHLATETSEVVVRGRGDVALMVKDILDVNIMGSGNVHYVGAPLVVQQIFGSGMVNRIP